MKHLLKFFIRKNILFLFIICCFFSKISGQDYNVSFNASESSSTIDSIIAVNLTTNDLVSLIGIKNLTLTSVETSNLLVWESQNDIECYPNPFIGSTNVKFITKQSGNIEFGLYNTIGKLLIKKKMFLSKGFHNFKVSCNNIGANFLTVTSGINKKHLKLICRGISNIPNRINYESFTRVSSEPEPLKSASSNSLYFEEGNVLLYKVYSDGRISVFTDSPLGSKDYSVDFYECKDADGRNYATVKIGEQIWMAENLAYLPYVNKYYGFKIPYNLNKDFIRNYDWDANIYVPGYSLFSVEEAKNNKYYKKYGAAYKGRSVMAAIPEGWHLPNKEDWIELENLVGNSYKLKSTSDWEPPGSNETGFSALPGGYMFSPVMNESGGGSIGEFASFITANFNDMGLTLTSPFSYSCGHFTVSFSEGNVRCIKNNTDWKLPVIETHDVQDIQRISANCTGTIQEMNGFEIYEKGFCWDTCSNPNYAMNIAADTISQIDYGLNCKIDGLNPNTTYYVKAYVITTNNRIAYGNETIFTTSGPEVGILTDERDGKKYNTVKLGNQWWMAENLAYLPEISLKREMDLETPAYYVLDDDSLHLCEDVEIAKSTEFYKRFGVLYNWKAACNSCPDGWHLPSDDEWKELELYVGMSETVIDSFGNRGDIADKLKSTSKSDWFINNIYWQGGTNEYNFDAKAAGGYGNYNPIGTYGMFMTSSDGIYRVLEVGKKSIGRKRFGNRKGLSVRCVKDE
ncbi:MAG: FISUMP domain-containing protein [bacterium]